MYKLESTDRLKYLGLKIPSALEERDAEPGVSAHQRMFTYVLACWV